MSSTDPTSAAGDSTTIVFEEGIIGVPRARRFELLEQRDSPLRVLRCLDINGFSLPVIDPYLADPRYSPNLAPRVTEALDLRGNAPVLLLAVVTREAAGPVANLRAPLVINPARRIGLQVILDDRTQPIRAEVGARAS